jgi:hypothetical protein
LGEEDFKGHPICDRCIQTYGDGNLRKAEKNFEESLKNKKEKEKEENLNIEMSNRSNLENPFIPNAGRNLIAHQPRVVNNLIKAEHLGKIQRRNSCAFHAIRGQIEKANQMKDENENPLYPTARMNKFKQRDCWDATKSCFSGNDNINSRYARLLNNLKYDYNKNVGKISHSKGANINDLLKKDGFVTENIGSNSPSKTIQNIRERIANEDGIMVAGGRFYSNFKGDKSKETRKAHREWEKNGKKGKEPPKDYGMHVLNIKDISPKGKHATIIDSNMNKETTGSISPGGTVRAPFYGENYLKALAKNPLHRAQKKPIFGLEKNQIIAIDHKKSAKNRENIDSARRTNRFLRDSR